MCQTCKPGNESIRIHPAGTKMKFEDRLSEKIGWKNGFVVPEGYFLTALLDEVRPSPGDEGSGSRAAFPAATGASLHISRAVCGDMVYDEDVPFDEPACNLGP